MKKKSIVLIMGVMTILFAFTGCKAETPVEQNKEEPTNIGSDFEKAEIPFSYNGIKYDEGKILFTVENTSKEEVTFGEAFKLEVGDKDLIFTEVEATKDMAFIEIAHVLNAGEKKDVSIDIASLNLENGEYRITKDYSSKGENFEGRLQFKVEDNEVTPTIFTTSLK